MPGPGEVIEIVRLTEQGIGQYTTSFDDFLRGHPELERIPVSRVPGLPHFATAAFVLAGAMQGGYFTGPEVILALMDGIVADLREKIAYLETAVLTPAEARAEIAELNDLRRRLAAGRALMVDMFPETAIVEPTPTQILRQVLPQLSRSVAFHELWRRGHHGQVHRPLAGAEHRRIGAELGFASTVVPAVSSLAEGLRAIVRVKLPELRHELVTLARAEAQLRRETDREIRTELRTEIRRVTERIGDVVRWLRTEALPELRDQVRAERAERVEHDRRLRERLQAETSNRTEADVALATQVGAAAAWIAGPGAHTAGKVRRTEGVFDQLLRSDLNWFAQLLTGGAFVALTMRILGKVAGEVPEILGGLEDAAVRAIGTVR